MCLHRIALYFFDPTLCLQEVFPQDAQGSRSAAEELEGP